MSSQSTLSKSLRLFVPVLVAGILLSLVFASLAGDHAIAAPIGDDPQVRAITITAASGVVVSDSQDGQAADGKTIYFKNFGAGTITVTADLSGTAPLTLTGEAGFSTASEVSSTSSDVGEVTYDVGPTDADQTILFTVTNSYSAPVTDTYFTLAFVQDVLSPTGAFTHPPSNAVFTKTHQPTVTLVVTAADSGAGLKAVQIATDTLSAALSATPGNGEWTYAWTLPDEDEVTHTLVMTAQDWVDNVITATRSAVVDTLAPAPSGTPLTADHTISPTWYSTTTVNVTWINAFNGSIHHYLYVWDKASGTTVTPATSGVNSTANTTVGTQLPTATDGGYYFHVTAVDRNGNWGSTVYTGPFRIDTTAPTSTISAPLAGAVLTGTSVTISGSVGDGANSSEIKVITTTVNGTPVFTNTSVNWSGIYTLPTDTDAVSCTLASLAQDTAGNVQASAYSRTVTVDTKSPTATVPIANGGVAWSPTTTLVFTWTPSTDNAGILRYDLLITSTGSQQINAGNATLYTLTDTIEGVGYIASLRAVDKSGNVGPWSAASTVITLDKTPPNVQYDVPPLANPSSKVYPVGASIFYSNSILNNITLQVTATDNLSLVSVEASPAPAGWLGPLAIPQPPKYAYSYSILQSAASSGVILVTGTDAAGLASARPFTYTLDAEVPTATVIAAPAYYSGTTSLTLTARADDALSGVGALEVYYRKDSGNWTHANVTVTTNSHTTSFTANPAISPNGDGVYQWRVVAVDNLGNTTDVPTASGDLTTTYDTHAPTATVTPLGVIANSPIAVPWAATDWPANIKAVALWVYTPTATSWTLTNQSDESGATSGTFHYTPTVSGVYTFYAQARDRAGNLMPTPSSILSGTAATYDPNAPDTSASVPSPYANYSPITVTYTATATAHLKAITLCVSINGGNWTSDLNNVLTGDLGAEVSGVFTYTPPTENAYYFAIAATANRTKPCPQSGPGDARVIYDTSIDSPSNARPDPAGWTNVNAFSVTWSNPSNPADLSGIAGAKYLFDIAPASNQSGRLMPGQGITQLTNLTVTTAGEHPIYIWLVDNAQNQEYQKHISTIFKYDNLQPTVTFTVPHQINAASVILRWWGEDVMPGSGLASYSLSYQYNGGSSMLVGTYPATQTEATVSSINPAENGVYRFTLTAFDAAGNFTTTERVMKVATFRVYLPIVVNNYPPLWSRSSGTAGAKYRTPSVCATNNQIWYAGTPDSGDIWQSTNGAQGFTALGLGNLQPDPYPVLANPNNCTEAFITYWGGGVVKSSNPTAKIGPTAYLYALINANGQLFAGASADGVYRAPLEVSSSNQWTQINTGLSDQRVRSLYASGNDLYAGTRACQIFKSTNNGDSWTTAGTPAVLSGGTAGACGDAQVWSMVKAKSTLYAGLGLEKGVYYFNGTLWAAVPNVPVKTVYGLAYDGTNDILYISVYGAGIYRCTVDAQGRPSACGPYNSQLSAGALNTREIAIGNNRLVISTDDGLWSLPLFK